ncbi:MAG: SDR family NAD(P)-dependent oxidoreductase [Paracoccus sp. (in: a-proteobacteria)]
MGKRYAFVTGGSAGIGFEIAKLLAEDNHDLLVSGSSDRVNSAADELRALGADVDAVKSDLATDEGTDAVWKALSASGRAIDVAVFNAGIATGGTFKDLPLEDHLRLVAINIVSPLRLAHRVVSHMVGNGRGRILLVSSMSARTPTPFEGVYGPSKAFLTSFGYGLREELRGTGVTVTILHPGSTATEFHARAGMGDTAFGDNSLKNDPVLVARQGYDAMMQGESSVVGGDEKTQQDWVEMRSMSEEDKARRHAGMAGPKDRV